jgi:hypothetical protein
MAGAIVVTTSDLGGGVSSGITKYSIAWTSDAGGNVNANPFPIRHGRLLQVKFVPTNGGVQPAANYNVTLPDADGVDLLAGKGAALSNVASTFAQPVPPGGVSPVFIESNPAIVPTVAAAGIGTNGRIDLLVGP